MNAIELGAKLRLERHWLQLNQEDVAKALNISVPAYSKIETGVTDINLSRLNQIAAFYGKTASSLLDPVTEVQFEEVTVPAVNKDQIIIDLQAKVIDLLELNARLRWDNEQMSQRIKTVIQPDPEFMVKIHGGTIENGVWVAPDEIDNNNSGLIRKAGKFDY